MLSQGFKDASAYLVAVQQTFHRQFTQVFGVGLDQPTIDVEGRPTPLSVERWYTSEGWLAKFTKSEWIEWRNRPRDDLGYVRGLFYTNARVAESLQASLVRIGRQVFVERHSARIDADVFVLVSASDNPENQAGVEQLELAMRALRSA